MEFLIVIVGGLIEAATVLGGVWLAQFLRDRHDAERRVNAAFAEAQVGLSLIIETLAQSASDRSVWREPYTGFNGKIAEIESLAIRLKSLYRLNRHRSRLEACLVNLNDFRARFTAAVTSVKATEALSVAQAYALGKALNIAARSVRTDLLDYDHDEAMKQLFDHIRFYASHGADAERPADWRS